MKKLLSILLLMSTPAYAEDSYYYMYTSHLCDTPKKIFNFIETKYNEKLLFTGWGLATYKDPTSNLERDAPMMFFVNQTTGTWSLVYIFNNDSACVMETGQMFEPY